MTDWNPKVGGFAGVNHSGTIQNCHAGGAVTADHASIPAGGFLGASENNAVTEDCSYDKSNNESLSSVGGTESSGTNNISGVTADELKANICRDYYGGHSYSSEWTVDTAAACTKAGSKSHHCERCGEKTDITAVPATGHTFIEYISDNNATCTGNSTETAKCSICGEEGTREIEGSALGHSWEDAWEADSTHHWHNCGNAGCPVTANSQKNGYEAHVYDSDADKDCNICGHERIADASSVTSKLQQTGLTEVPEGLKNTGFHTVEQIETELLGQITTQEGYTSQNTAVYEINLLLSTDGGNT